MRACRSLLTILATLLVLAVSSRPVAAQGVDATLDELLQSQLRAGEFGPALETALAVKQPAVKSRLLDQIAAAQRQSGEVAAARTTRRLQANSDRQRGDEIQPPAGSTGAGGGNGADFTELMELIENTIAPDSWDAVGGPGTQRPFETGVRIDPQGLLARLTKEEDKDRLSRLAQSVRAADLHSDMARQSGLRFISLPRLERAVAELIRTGQPIPETMRRLGGMTQIRHVFVFPEEQEIIIAGPAEGWKYDGGGRPLSNEGNSPLMDLDDLVTVLRTFSPGGENIFGCSINPREANLKSVKDFVEASNAKGPLRPGQLGKWLKELHTRLGLQDIVVYGVPANTNVARVLVEADYRMKLIGIDKLDGGLEIPSYFDLLQRMGKTEAAPMDALRWWLTMKYSSVEHSADRTAYELTGSSVLVQSEHQFVTDQGKHVASGQTEPINQMFAKNFTDHYANLAKRDPVFAELHRIMDMAMVAALLRSEHAYERAGWKPDVFARDGEYTVREVASPKVVDSVINHRVYGGKNIVVQVAGGVRIDTLNRVLEKDFVRAGDVASTPVSRDRLQSVPKDRWWWDARQTDAGK